MLQPMFWLKRSKDGLVEVSRVTDSLHASSSASSCRRTPCKFLSKAERSYPILHPVVPWLVRQRHSKAERLGAPSNAELIS